MAVLKFWNGSSWVPTSVVVALPTDAPLGWRYRPAYVVGTSTDTTGTLDLVVPALTLPGDLIVIGAATRNSVLGDTPTGVSGWTTLFYGDTGSDEDNGAWVKIAEEGDAGAAVSISSSSTISAAALTVIRHDDESPFTSFEYGGTLDVGATNAPPAIAAEAGDVWVGVWTGSYDGAVTQNVRDWGAPLTWVNGALAQYLLDAWASCQFVPVVMDQTISGITHNRNDGGYLSAGCVVAR